MHSRRQRAPSLGALILPFLVVALPLARGGVDDPVEVAAILLALLAFATATRREHAVPTSALALVGVLAIAAAQLVPVPPALHALSPGALRIFEVSLAPVGLYPAPRPLSLDPAASVRALSRAIACAAAFAAAWAHAGSHRGSLRMVRGLALGGVGVAGAVLGAPLVGVGDLLAPRFPFVNPNHLAAFLDVTAFSSLGLALRARGQARALWAMAFAASGAVVFLSLSRAGIGAFFLGSAVFTAFHVLARPADAAPGPWRHVLFATALSASVGIAAFLAFEPILGELRTVAGGANDLKIRLLAPALRVVADFPVAGTGPGAFESVFPAYQSESASVTFTHLENDWLQPLVDLGLPGGLLLVGAFTATWVLAARRRNLSPPEVGLLAGTAAVAAHDLFDFSLSVLGVGLPFAVAMGILARGQHRISAPPWVLRALVGCGVAVAVAALAAGSAHDLDRDRDRVDRAPDVLATSAAARDALRWHPADWVSHATAGVRLADAGRCRDGMPWLLRAMALDPSAPEPHLAAARCLAGRDDVAAKREYRLAILSGSPALPEAARRYPGMPDLLDIAPVTPDGLLELGLFLRAGGRAADAELVLRQVVEGYGDERAVLPLGWVRASQRDHTEAIALARRHVSARPSDPGGWLLAASSLLELGREDDSRAEVERGLAVIPGSPALLEFLAERAMAAHRWSEAKRLAEEIAPRTAAEIAWKHLLAARALAGQQRFGEALDRARSAASATPDVQAGWVAVADYAARAGLQDEAIEALRRAATLADAPSDGYARRLAELEAARQSASRDALERRALGGETVPQ